MAAIWRVIAFWQGMWRHFAHRAEVQATEHMLVIEEFRREYGGRVDEADALDGVRARIRFWLAIADVCYALAGGRVKE